jgi:hypothetical protein
VLAPKYHDGLHSLPLKLPPKDHEGLQNLSLEDRDGLHSLEASYNSINKGQHHEYANPSVESDDVYFARKNEKRFCGLRPTTFWLLAVIGILAIFSIIGGGVLGSLVGKSQSPVGFGPQGYEYLQFPFYESV